MTYSVEKVKKFKANLQESVLICSERCLLNATHWTTEIINGIEYPDHEKELLTDSIFYPASLETTNYESKYPRLTEQEYNRYQYAKSAFQMRQYENAHHLLKGHNAPRLKFLRLYAFYLAGEKGKAEEMLDILGSTENPQAENSAIPFLYEELLIGYDKGELDAFCLYLYGVVLRKRKEYFKAAKVLLRSIHEYEYNWSAWMELCMIVQDETMFEDIKQLLNSDMPDSIMKDFFLAKVSLRLHLPKHHFDEAIKPLTEYFSNSAYITTQHATAFYEANQYKQASDLFQDIQERHPYRIEGLELYSNMLFLESNAEKLSLLADQCMRVDKYRTETCCVIANYYNISRNIDKSIEYLKRALKLDRSVHWVWTLLGHDYIEVKNTDAAIVCYRRAIDENPSDYRAWYALGQTYQILNLDAYAVSYYNKTLELRPHDIRVWKCLVECHDRLGNREKREYCHQKAQQCKIGKPCVAAIELARLFAKMGQQAKAVKNYIEVRDKYSNRKDMEGEVAEANLFVARDFIAKTDYSSAESFIEPVLSMSYPYNAEAKELLKELVALKINRRDEEMR
ncbi:anaphase promoting complex subunit 8 [Phycomyces blakesleeanus]|uniref:Anaphase promoting complex subunit 8 n=1 Tax=Phycomyces blakesleeanus TaxID=4837 RepID=A0ABR3BG65_PHYBL